jgi:hypothetical protein
MCWNQTPPPTRRVTPLPPDRSEGRAEQFFDFPVDNSALVGEGKPEAREPRRKRPQASTASGIRCQQNCYQALFSERLHAGLRMAVALWMFWYVRGYRGTRSPGHTAGASNGPRSSETVCPRSAGGGPVARAQGDQAAAHDLTQRSLALYRATEEGPGLVTAVVGLAPA